MAGKAYNRIPTAKNKTGSGGLKKKNPDKEAEKYAARMDAYSTGKVTTAKAPEKPKVQTGAASKRAVNNASANRAVTAEQQANRNEAYRTGRTQMGMMHAVNVPEEYAGKDIDYGVLQLENVGREYEANYQALQEAMNSRTDTETIQALQRRLHFSVQKLNELSEKFNSNKAYYGMDNVSRFNDIRKSTEEMETISGDVGRYYGYSGLSGKELENAQDELAMLAKEAKENGDTAAYNAYSRQYSAAGRPATGESYNDYLESTGYTDPAQYDAKIQELQQMQLYNLEQLNSDMGNGITTDYDAAMQRNEELENEITFWKDQKKALEERNSQSAYSGEITIDDVNSKAWDVSSMNTPLDYYLQAQQGIDEAESFGDQLPVRSDFGAIMDKNIRSNFSGVDDTYKSFVGRELTEEDKKEIQLQIAYLKQEYVNNSGRVEQEKQNKLFKF